MTTEPEIYRKGVHNPTRLQNPLLSCPSNKLDTHLVVD